MNVKYDYQRARRASFIRKTEAQKKKEREDREKFQKEIRELKPGTGEE